MLVVKFATMVPKMASNHADIVNFQVHSTALFRRHADVPSEGREYGHVRSSRCHRVTTGQFPW